MKKEYAQRDIIIIICILTFAIVAGLALYQDDSPFYNEVVSTIIRIFMYLLCGVMIICVYKNLRKVDIGAFIPLFLGIYMLIDAYVPQSLNILNTITLVLIFLVQYYLRVEIISLYRKWIIILSIFGIIGYLFYVLNVGFPYEITPYYSTNFFANYINYKFTYIFSAGTSLRLCGLFNEPGFLGTITALLLCIDNLNLKHIGNWILFIAGIMSFSAAFVIIIVFYLIFNSIKNKKTLGIVICLLIIYFFVLPKMTFSNQNIATLVQRITWINNGFAGDNRSNVLIDEIFTQLWNTKYIFFGHGGGYCSSLNSGGVASFKTYIIDYGIVGFFIMYGLLFIYAIKKCKKNWKAISFVVVFFLSVYQRPSIFSPIYFILLLYGIDIIVMNGKLIREKD